MFIWIESQSGPVLQKDEDPPGVLVLPLTGRRRYDVELTLNKGQNLITVMDSKDQTEKAWLTLFADEGTRPAHAQEREAVRNGIMRGEARNGDMRRENPPPDPADRTVRSGSGKLSVVAIHDNKHATLDVAAPDLRGPFKIAVKDDSDNVVDTRTKKLERGDAGFVESIPLKAGQNTVIVASHFRLHARRQRDPAGRYLFNSHGRPLYEANPNIAPELISWLTLSAGRWENFEIMVPTGQMDANGEEIKVRQRPWRIEALGRLKIPETPFIIGFDGNFGKGPDDVRFLFGTRFDIGKIMRTLKLAAAQDRLGQSTPAPAPAPAPDNTPSP